MINLPDPPEGYRWKVKPCNHDNWTSTYYDIDVRLEKKTLGIWFADWKMCVPKKGTRAASVVDTAKRLLLSYEKQKAAKKEEESLYGVYERDEK